MTAMATAASATTFMKLFLSTVLVLADTMLQT
jgi:hypothetical protein